jgi:hypothetical protein
MRARLLVLALPVLGCSGCGSTEPSSVPPGNVRAFLSTIGIDLDLDGYVVHVGDQVASISSGGRTGLALPAGTYDAWLEDVASNCAVAGPDTVSVTVPPGDLALVAFEVECRTATAAIVVTAPTGGRDFDADGYTAYVDKGTANERVVTLFTGGSATIEELGAGTHQVSLEDLAPNCAVSGPASVAIDLRTGLASRHTGHVLFQVSCAATTGDLRLVTVTSGPAADADGYQLLVDGTLAMVTGYGWYYYYGYDTPLQLSPVGDAFIGGVAPGNRTLELTEIAPNCVLNGANPRSVPVGLGDTTVVNFQVVCTDQP